MKIADIVGFRREIFFEGAVQLGWLDKMPARADLAARSYMFHGPAFHAVGKKDLDEDSRHAALKDTATFFRELIAIASGKVDNERHNPFGIAIAGYGTGKSHLGLTLSRLLATYPGEPSQEILDRLEMVAPGLGTACRADLDAAAAPVLVVALDGMKDFHLGGELYARIVGHLKQRGLDLGPIDDLSPRFKHAEAFTVRNFSVRRGDFEAAFGAGVTVEEIAERLSLRDEAAFQAVNGIYRAANGTDIGGHGQESPEELITTVCSLYCGPGKPFASMMIIFDEFGRYLEFTADKPHIAGDACLQQMYQGVQTAGAEGRCYFLGLIQFEMKAYLSQLEKREAQQLQRFVSRFDQAEKTLLSSNLETLFANIIERKAPADIQRLLTTPTAEAQWRSLHGQLCQSLRALPRFEAWANFENFRRVIVEGCWPLHPTTVWFLARLSNVVQNRSALSFIEQAIERAAEQPAETEAGLPFQIYPVDLMLGEMFTEIIEAEKRTHATIANEFASIRERHAGRWTPEQERALASVVIARKMQAQATSQTQAHEFLASLAGMPSAEFGKAMKEIIATFGVAEWNNDSMQYDLIIDAVPRSHFTLALRKRAGEFGTTKTLEYFRLYGRDACELKVPEANFAYERAISTSDWSYDVTCTVRESLKEDVLRAVEAWRDAVAPESPKGHLIYLLVDDPAKMNAIIDELSTTLEQAIQATGMQTAPVFGVVLADADGELMEYLARLAVLTKHLSSEEKARYVHFLESEEQSLREKLRTLAELEIKQRRFVFPPNVRIEGNRLNVVATQLFEAVYPNVFPFVFDGFGTSRGNAAKDCAALTRALACGQLDGNWFSTQSPPTQNRAKQLLGKVWQVLADDMRPISAPGYEPLKRLVETLNARLARAQALDLHAIFIELIAPPFGFNSASAALALSVFLNDREISKSIMDGDSPIAVDAWLIKIYNGKQLIDPARLKRTSVVPCTAGQDWEQLLNRWYGETRHRRNLALDEEAARLKATAAVPSHLVDSYYTCKARVERSHQAVDGFEARLDKICTDLEEAGTNLSAVLNSARQALSLCAETKADEAWEESDIARCQGLIDRAQEIVRAHFAEWLDKERPENAEAVPAFQEGMRRHQVTLERLGLVEEKLALQTHINRALDILKAHMAADLRASSLKTFLNAHKASPATPVPTLRQWVKDGQHHMEQLQSIERSAEEQTLLESLRSRLVDWELLLTQHRDAVARLGARTISRFSDVVAALEEAVALSAAFQGTDEAARVDAIREQLAAVTEDWSDLQTFEGTEDELRGIMRARLANRIPFDTMPWNNEQLYDTLMEERLEALRDRSERWFISVIPNAEALYTWGLARCQEATARLGDCPSYAPMSIRTKVELVTHALASRITDLEEQERVEKVRRWCEKCVPSLEAIAGFGLEQLRASHRELSGVPVYFTPFEAEEVARVRGVVEERLDQLDFQQLVERARRLPLERQRQLAEALMTTPQEA